MSNNGLRKFTLNNQNFAGLVSYAIDEFHERATKGDRQAAKQLYWLAYHASLRLKSIALYRPDLLLEWSQKEVMFPAMICPNKGMDKIHKQIIDRCQVGTKAPVNAKSSSAMPIFTESSPPGKREAWIYYAIMLDIRDGIKTTMPEHIVRKIKKLPPPSKAAYKSWSRAMRSMLPGVEGIAKYDFDRWKDILRLNIPDHEKTTMIKRSTIQALKTILPVSTE